MLTFLFIIYLFRIFVGRESPRFVVRCFASAWAAFQQPNIAHTGGKRRHKCTFRNDKKNKIPPNIVIIVISRTPHKFNLVNDIGFLR